MFTYRFPLCLQRDAMQCGVSCLKMVLTYFGRNRSIEELESVCHPTHDGVSLWALSQTAEYFGLKTSCGKYSIQEIVETVLPCILHWNQNHFVVLYRIKQTKGRTRYYIADPAKGKYILNEQDFTDCWVGSSLQQTRNGVAMTFANSSIFGKNHKKNDNKPQSLHFMWVYIRQYRQYFFQIFLGLLIGCGFQLALPLFTQAVVDIGISKQNVHFIYLVLVGQFVLIVSSTTVDFIRRWLLLHISVRVNLSLVSDFFAKLFRLPMSFFDVKQTGDILQRINDYNRILTFITQQSLSILFAFTSTIVFSGVLLFYNKIIFLVFLIFTLIHAIWLTLFLRKRKLLDYDTFEKQAESQDCTYQLINSMQEIKLQGCESHRRWEWEDTQISLYKLRIKNLQLSQSEGAGSILINSTKNICITIFSAIAVIDGDLTMGMMLSVQYIIGQLSTPIVQLLRFIYSLQDIRISLNRINNLMGLPDENDKKEVANYSVSANKDITFKHVSFSYDKYSDSKTLDNINLHIPHNKITAIVGASGSGKTTLIKLLLGYYPTDNGKIFIGNTPLERIDLSYWRSQCGVVMQDGIIFSDTIARNIAVMGDNIDMKALKSATACAQISTFIEELPLRYNTKIGPNGMQLSMGQKQRILIARAIYRNPLYFILDEATNSLDTNNETAIVKALNNLFQSKTVIIIAHRISTVKHADNIVVLHKGQIVEQGTHRQLLEQGGYYFNLVSNQIQ